MKKKNYWIKIENEGEIDIEGLHLMGISSKRNEDKIGFFGSGNKYAIALLLREKILFRIFSGLKEVKIETEPVMFRKQLFHQIIINGQKTSLTTSMGVDWENWFAIREFYCNAVDEGEVKMTVEKLARPKKGKTIIFVDLSEKFGNFFEDINNYILVNKIRIDSVETEYGYVELLEKSDEFICYRKGIRIYPTNKEKSLYTYNFISIQINESRIFKYDHEVKERIASYFAVSQNREVILNFLQNWKGNFEEYALWQYANDKLSKEWQSILEGKRIYPNSIAITSGDYEAKKNSYIVPDNLAKKIAKELKGVEVVGFSEKQEYQILETNEIEKDKISQAKMELAQIGYKINCPIIVVKPFINDVIGIYDKNTQTICLARDYITSMGELKNTLLEEYFHHMGQKDGQRSFVTFLIDEIIKSKERKINYET